MAEDSNSEVVYVQRNQAGELVSVSLVADAMHGEAVSKQAGELQAFLQHCNAGHNDLARSDSDMSRVLEDLIDLLIDKEVMCFTDLPDAAQRKLMQRRRMRQSLTGSLLSDDESLI